MFAYSLYKLGTPLLPVTILTHYATLKSTCKTSTEPEGEGFYCVGAGQNLKSNGTVANISSSIENLSTCLYCQ